MWFLMADVIVRLWVDEKTLWENVFESGVFSAYPWWIVGLKYDNYYRITVQNPESDETAGIIEIVTMDDVIRGYEKYLQTSITRVDQIDCAVADEILQYAIFGELVFG